MLNTIVVHANPGDMLILGRKGEHLARMIRFDISKWMKLYGDGNVSLLHKRGDTETVAITLD